MHAVGESTKHTKCKRQLDPRTLDAKCKVQSAKRNRASDLSDSHIF